MRMVGATSDPKGAADRDGGSPGHEPIVDPSFFMTS